MEVGGSASQRPGRIPPPPLMEPEFGWEESEPEPAGQGIFAHDDDDNRTANNCILHVRCPNKAGGSAVVKIQVYEEMTSELLGRCVFQAISAYSSVHSDPVVVRAQNIIWADDI
jgi:hypothetical protein